MSKFIGNDTSVGSAGAVSDVKTVVDAIQAKTDNLPSDPADASVVAGNITTAHSTTDALITSESITQPKIVSRDTATLPENTQTPYFTVSGRVLITQIVGEVTGECSGTATNIKLVANPTVGADVDLCAVVAIASNTVGTLYTITGTLADAMVATASGAVQAQLAPILVAAGTIDLDASATNTGKTKWTLHYIPLDADSTVVTA